MRTRLFKWAKSQELTLEELAEMTGYSERHLRRIRKGEYPVTDSFRGQVVLHMGDWARSLFLPQVSEQTDNVTQGMDTLVAISEEAEPR